VNNAVVGGWMGGGGTATRRTKLLEPLKPLKHWNPLKPPGTS